MKDLYRCHSFASEYSGTPIIRTKIRGKFVRINRVRELSEQMIKHILTYLQSCVQDDCANSVVQVK